jgi:hypothetical protein
MNGRVSKGAPVININVRSDLRALTRSLTNLALQQVPFATAQALNKVAARVKAAEQENIRATFKKPTPFTQNSVSTTRATKNNQFATVFVRPIAARYLLPYEVGGNHVLNSRALLNPKDIRLNQYGQLPRSTLASLRVRPDVFIGKVQTKHGLVDGVWQRVVNNGRPAPLNAKGKKLRGLNKTGHLKLLIRFGDALPVNKELNYGKKARQVIDQHLASDFNIALNEAVRTAR